MSQFLQAAGFYLPKSADKAFAKLGAVSFWAENGMVCISKELPDGSEEFKQAPPSEMRVRREGMIDLAKHTMSEHGPDESRRKMFQDFVESLDRVIKKAEEQGPFEDLSSRRDRVRRRAKQISVSNNQRRRG